MQRIERRGNRGVLSGPSSRFWLRKSLSPQPQEQSTTLGCEAFADCLGGHFGGGCGFRAPSIADFYFKPLFTIGPVSITKPIVLAVIAGAIVLGRTNIPEFAFQGWTDNDVFGPTRNPWGLEWSPGGSSGGAARGGSPFQDAPDAEDRRRPEAPGLRSRPPRIGSRRSTSARSRRSCSGSRMAWRGS